MDTFWLLLQTTGTIWDLHIHAWYEFVVLMYQRMPAEHLVRGLAKQNRKFHTISHKKK